MQELDGTGTAQANRLLAAALDSLGHALLVLDAERRVVALNARFAALFAIPAHATLPGTGLETLLAAPLEADIDVIGARTVARPGRAIPATFQRSLQDGRVIAVRWSALEAGGWACACEDVTARRTSESRLAHVSRHDPLTGLPNRQAFQEAVQRAVLRRLPGQAVAVLLLDLDRFRQANDALGPRAGDALLQQAAERLREVLRQEEPLARLGGDEFALVLAAAEPDIAQAAAQAAGRAIAALAAPFAVADSRIVLGASIGIALADPMATERPPAEEVDALLHNARLAVGRAKAEGRGTWQFFAPGMDTEMQARRSLEADLREALEAGQFELHFQPLIGVASRSVVAFEALIRWRHPVRGLVPPDRFIPLAEELGLIVPIGAWVLATACRAAAGWPAGAAGPVRVAVNLSSVQFGQAGLVEMVAETLRESGLAGARLELEITESILLADSAATLATLGRLRAMGVRISLDDFGTGYSSLSYLNSFPFDKLKIDKSFVQAMIPADRPSDSLAPQGARSPAPQGADAIVRAIASLGASLGIATTAEGVETRAQLDMLVAVGCTEMQGYLFSPPRPACEVPALLEAAARRAA